MDDVGRAAHWERIFSTKAPEQLSWYQASPERSLELIAKAGVGPDSEVIDVGGGDSTLVDALLDRRWGHVTVLDISDAALRRARARLGARARDVTWISGDVTRLVLPDDRFDLWHDRAVFHFLTEVEDRRRYVDAVRRSVKRGGYVIVATFAPDGPARCSGLAVTRYDPEELYAEFGAELEMIESARDVHRTPSGVAQPFTYVLLRRR